MAKHPRAGAGLLRLEFSEFRFFGAVRSDFCRTSCPTAAATPAGVGGADFWLVTAALVGGESVAAGSTHQREIWREDEAAGLSLADGARSNRVALFHAAELLETPAVIALVIINWHGRFLRVWWIKRPMRDQSLA